MKGIKLVIVLFLILTIAGCGVRVAGTKTLWIRVNLSSLRYGIITAVKWKSQ